LTSVQQRRLTSIVETWKKHTVTKPAILKLAKYSFLLFQNFDMII
jgi:hypothetical protein